MPNPVAASRRKALDIAYLLFLLSGFLIFGLALFLHTHPVDDDPEARGFLFLYTLPWRVLTALTTAAALIVGGIRSFIRPRDWGVALASTLTYLLLLGLISGIPASGIGKLLVDLLYALATTLLALLWFLERRWRWGPPPAPPHESSDSAQFWPP
jgi:hypothetical protein